MRPVTLIHGQPIRLTTWTHNVCRIWTVRGYAVSMKSRNSDRLADEVVAFGRGVTAFCVADMHCKADDVGAAVVLRLGDVVSIEGQMYRVDVRDADMASLYPLRPDVFLFTPVT